MTKLFDDYYYEIAELSLFRDFYSKNRPKVFNAHFSFDLYDFLSKEQQECDRTHHNKNAYNLRILIYKNKEIIGWHFGFSKQESFYMTNTGILKEFQNKGIYKALLKEIIAIVKKKGFAKITSTHLMSNNAVLVPKLKMGFYITGIEIKEAFGTLVNLTYFINEKFKKAYLMRTGEKKLDKL